MVGTDINPRGFGTKANILDIQKPLGDGVITNPPFSKAEEIIRHVMGVLKPEYFALLLKSTFWHADERTALFNTYRPTMIAGLPWRPDFNGLGRPTMECSWVVWDQRHPTYNRFPEYHLLPNLNPRKRNSKPR